MTIKDTAAMISQMSPVLTPDVWVYCCEADPTLAAARADTAFSVIREAEGTTLILPIEDAARHGYDCALEMRLITLNVFSDLEGVGLTAAVAQALTLQNISCNVVAGYHHDHVFVPKADATQAMDALTRAQSR